MERPRGARHFALPLLFLAIAAFGGAIIEGAPADWGAIRLERMGVSPSASALALAIFMAGMLAGRMVGDHLTDRFGGARVLRAGTLLVTFGTLLGVIVSEPWAFATGLALAGIGTSGVIPLAFSAAGRMPGVSPGFGAATVSLTARIGFLVEPVLMGVTAELTSLRVAFLNVAVVGLVLAALAPRISPRGLPTRKPSASTASPAALKRPSLRWLGSTSAHSVTQVRRVGWVRSSDGSAPGPVAAQHRDRAGADLRGDPVRALRVVAREPAGHPGRAVARCGESRGSPGSRATRATATRPTGPSYSYVAPMSWLVRRDVEEGRHELNFSEWDRDSGEADDAIDAIVDGSMPPSRYTRIHRDAKLTAEEAQRVIDALARMEDDD